MTHQHMKIVDDAIQFAVDAHKGQYRKSYELPYIVHPIEVMKRISTWGVLDPDLSCAAVLHDVLEDTPIGYGEIFHNFGGVVADVVQELTRPDDDGQSFYAKYEYLKEFAVSSSTSAILVKLADRISNVNDYMSKPGNKKYAGKYAVQAHPVYLQFFKREDDIEYRYGKTVCKNIRKDLKSLERIVHSKFMSQYSIDPSVSLDLVDAIMNKGS